MAEEGSGKLKKVEVDCSELVAKKIPELSELAKRNLSSAVEQLLNVEKQCRQGEDELSAHKVCVAIVKVCWDVGDFKALNENIVLLSKRRGQYPQALVKVVRECMSYLDDPKLTKELYLELVETLRLVSAGKIFVEVERARLTLRLSRFKEKEGDVAGACSVLQDVQVETLGAMDKREKVEFILEQVRLCIDSKDFIRCKIIANKVSEKAIAGDDMQDLKLRYHKLMVQYFTNEGDNLAICRAYQSMYNTEQVRNDSDYMCRVLRDVCIFVCLSPRGPDQQDILTRTYADKNLEKLPEMTRLLKFFVTPELVAWDAFRKEFEGPLLADKQFAGELKSRWDVMRKRVNEHNIRVVEKYYSKVRMQRLGILLSLTPNEAEAAVSEMVVAKSIYAKIDRPAGIISFERPSSPATKLNGWGENISELLKLVEKCTHDIQKENMMHAKKI